MSVSATVTVSAGPGGDIRTAMDSRGHMSIQMDNGSRWTVMMSNDGRLIVRLVDGPLGSGIVSLAVHPRATNSIEISPSA